MEKLNPAARTGLMWAGVHQAFALIALAAAYIDLRLFVAAGVILLLLDWPLLLLGAILGFSEWLPASLSALAKRLPDGGGSPDLIVWILSAGALQWFLVGCAVGVRRARREACKLARTDKGASC